MDEDESREYDITQSHQHKTQIDDIAVGMLFRDFLCSYFIKKIYMKNVEFLYILYFFFFHE